MRLVPVNSIKDGTILAKTIYNSTGIPLLRAGYPLNENIINRALDNGISSLYILDSYSDEIISDVICPEIRQRAVRILKNSFENMQKISTGRTMSRNKMSEQIHNITIIGHEFVENILSNKDIAINLVDIKTMDDYTYQHCVNTAILAIILGIELGYYKSQLQAIAVGALLHDFGKVFIPKSVLLKPGKLTDYEFAQIQDHPLSGYNYLNSHIDLDNISLSIISQHHEKVNGTGYPNKLYDRKISVFAKMIAICDVYDALTSNRPYRKAMSPNEAIELIMGSCGVDFDLDIVKAFMKRIIPYPVGTLVYLSNQQVAVIKDLNAACTLRPIVQVVDIFQKQKTVLELDLMKEMDIVIEGRYEEE